MVLSLWIWVSLFISWIRPTKTTGNTEKNVDKVMYSYRFIANLGGVRITIMYLLHIIIKACLLFWTIKLMHFCNASGLENCDGLVQIDIRILRMNTKSILAATKFHYSWINIQFVYFYKYGQTWNLAIKEIKDTICFCFFQSHFGCVNVNTYSIYNNVCFNI